MDDAYGYGVDATSGEHVIDRMRREEFQHMNDGLYLDHAGATTYAKSQLDASFDELRGGLFGNPHSQSPASTATESAVDAVRRQLLEFFNTTSDDYALVFTSGATAALKLVGECFTWSSSSTFAYAIDSHTSVLGIRPLARQAGAALKCVTLDEMDNEELRCGEATKEEEDSQGEDNDSANNLFAFPAECNFSGTQHALDLIERVRRRQVAGCTNGTWFVLLDAAKYAASHRLDLKRYQPDFVALSFYKLFGYPTGLGALLIKRSALHVLRKTYYGGGTVSNISATKDFAVFRNDSHGDGATRLGDGTVPFLSILALKHGLRMLNSLSMTRVAAHTSYLVGMLRTRLGEMKHWNDRPVCELYGGSAGGSIVAFNLLRCDGSYVGSSEVNKLASLNQIHIRAGCFCNPGACQHYLKLRDEDILASMKAGHVCGDDVDLVNGVPTGAVRVSVGYMTTLEECNAFLAFCEKYFVGRAAPVPVHPQSAPQRHCKLTLAKITVFPVKSCAGMVVDSWAVGSRGLLFDREWAIVDSNTNKALSLKDLPELCFVRPDLDLQRQELTIHWTRDEGPDTSADSSSFILSLHESTERQKRDPSALRAMRVCGGACEARNVGDAVSAWLSGKLGRRCALVRVASDHLRSSQATQPKHQLRSQPADPAAPPNTSPGTAGATIGFANQAQFLLISRQSVAFFNDTLQAIATPEKVLEDVFRANFIVDGCEAAFDEDAWQQLSIGDASFEVSGPCSRCSMINIDPETGAYRSAPLKVLSTFRRERASIFFGQFLTRIAVGDQGEGNHLAWVHSGDLVAVNSYKRVASMHAITSGKP